MRLNFKRLYLLSAKASRTCAGLVELTPARLDLLTTVMRYERSQTRLAELLCVAHSVVSRMVRALEALGLVQRRIPEEDRRLRLVRLTPRGLRQIAPLLDAPLPDDGSRGAQCSGEAAWLAYWKKPLARLGLAFDTLLASAEPPFWTLRAYNRPRAYLPWFLSGEGQPFEAST